MSALDDLVPTTELDAVNLMLATIGETPVSTLVVSGLTDVSIAKTTLAEQNRAVQKRGWDFNTDRDYQLALDLDSKIEVPPNALQIDAEDKSRDVVYRGGFMYDRDKNQFTFDNALKFKIIRYFSFEDLPEAARYYIAIRAARIFQKRILGDDTVDVFTAEQEVDAKIDLEDADSETADRNMMNDPELHSFVRAGRDPRSAHSF